MPAAPVQFDVAVIGRGLIGAAAARHLVEAGHRVALVGSGELADYAASNGPFSSHYDQGRITCIGSPNSIWSELAARSIDRYGDIAARSGISFHEPRGMAHVSSHTQAALDNAAARGGNARRVERDWLRATPGIAIRPDHPGHVFYEGPPAGVINPRRLVAAQTALALAGGATLVDSPASAISRHTNGFHVACGSTINADKILLATGAYGAELVGVKLVVQRRLRTIVLAELGPGRKIPAFVDDSPEHPELDEIYWVPPVPFPDGRTMLKIGGNSLPMIIAESDADILAWFRAGGSEREVAPFQQTIRPLLPDAKTTSWAHKPCVVTYTDAELPYLGFVDAGVAVALGASGSGAKSSDEIGRLAATLVSDPGWNDPVLELGSFAPQMAL